MTPIEYRSTDPGAPVLTGQVGSVVALLKTCLVGTAGVAYGSGPSEKLAAGWTLAFEDVATHKIALRNAVASGGSGCYSRIHDNATGTAGAKEAFLRTYASMSDIDTGSDVTPTTAQMTNGAVIRKSSTADSTARSWILIADDHTWYLQISSNPSSGYEESIYGSGDFDTLIPGDNYRFFTMARNAENTLGGACGWIRANATSAATPSSSTLYGMWLGRGYAGTGTAIPAVLATTMVADGTAIGGGVASIADSAPGLGGRLYIPSMIVTESSVRGLMRGMYLPICNVTAATGATDASPNGLTAGSVLTILRAQSSTTSPLYLGAIAIEKALEWA